MYALHMYIPYVNIHTISVSVYNNRTNCNGDIESNLKTIYNTEFFIFVFL